MGVCGGRTVQRVDCGSDCAEKTRKSAQISALAGVCDLSACPFMGLVDGLLGLVGQLCAAYFVYLYPVCPVRGCGVPASECPGLSVLSAVGYSVGGNPAHDAVVRSGQGSAALADLCCLQSVVPSGAGNVSESGVKGGACKAAAFMKKNGKAKVNERQYSMLTLNGKGVCGEICEGTLFFYRSREVKVVRQTVEDAERELLRFARARERADRQLQELQRLTAQDAETGDAAIFESHRMLLADAEYVELVEKLIRTRSINLEYAIQTAEEEVAGMFAVMKDADMRERIRDVRDVSRRLLLILEEDEAAVSGSIALTSPVLIVADDLLPSETVQFPRDKVLGFLLRKGSTASHAAILAKSMGIPAIVGLGEIPESFHGAAAIADGSTGTVYIEPDEATRAVMEEKKAQADRRKVLLSALKGLDNITKDGRRIRVYANVGGPEDAASACANDAGGIGLLRSEVLYLGRESAPDEETQFAFYRQILEQMQGKEVIIRTMDIGADKQVPYLGLSREENPALGLRAIRIGLTRPELLRTQLRALYRAGLYGKLAIMYPMITAPEELVRLRGIEAEVKGELAREGIPFAGEIPSGIMIETPAAALLSDELARLADFFSVGTNDLTQYTLALDRQNEVLEPFRDKGHRAVLRLIELAAQNARKAGIRIGICGELAADTSLTERFIRMGIDELSVAPGEVLPLRQHIRQLDIAECEEKS